MRLLLPLALLCACDPAYPRASGKLIPALPTDGYNQLLLVSRPGPCALPVQQGPEPQVIGAPVPLTGGDYDSAGEIGISQVREHCVIAWAAKDDKETEPTPGAPYGLRAFEAPPCKWVPFLPPDGYCGFVEDLDVVLDQRAP